MAVYIGYLLLISIQAYLFSKYGNKDKKYYLILCCAELILLAGLRGETVGADMHTYLNSYSYYLNMPKIEMLFAELIYPYDFEAGYFLLMKICAFLGMSKTMFLFVIASVIYIPLFYVIYKYSKQPCISIMVYFAIGLFSYSLGIFRQMMAISIILWGIQYIEKRELLKYIITILVAMSLHTTALIALPLYFICIIDIKKIILFVVPLELICLFFGRSFIELSLYIFPEYASYFNGKYDVQGGSYLMLLFLNAILFANIFFLCRGKIKTTLSMYALIFAIMLQAMGYSMAIAGRIVPYYSVFTILAIPDVLSCFDDKRIRKAFTVLCALGLIVLAIKDFWGNTYVCPYYLFWMN